GVAAGAVAIGLFVVARAWRGAPVEPPPATTVSAAQAAPPAPAASPTTAGEGAPPQAAPPPAPSAPTTAASTPTAPRPAGRPRARSEAEAQVLPRPAGLTMIRGARTVGAVLLGSALLLGSAAAAADPVKADQDATRLFKEGRAAMAAGDHAQARAKLAESQR